jgi:hypothetical protein
MGDVISEYCGARRWVIWRHIANSKISEDLTFR